MTFSRLIKTTVIFISICLLFSCAKKEEEGFVSLFDGKTLEHWKIPEGDNGHWRVVDGIIDYDGKSEAPGDKTLWSKKEYADFILKVDWRLTQEPVEEEVPVIRPDGYYPVKDDESKKTLNRDEAKTVKVMDGGDSGIYVRGSSKCQLNIWSWPIGSGEVYGYRTDAKISDDVRQGVTPTKCADNPPGEWNSFVVTMKGDLLTVVLNGETVIKNARLPGCEPTGPIALQHHTDPVEFSNISIKELN